MGVKGPAFQQAVKSLSHSFRSCGSKQLVIGQDEGLRLGCKMTTTGKNLRNTHLGRQLLLLSLTHERLKMNGAHLMTPIKYLPFPNSDNNTFVASKNLRVTEWPLAFRKVILFKTKAKKQTKKRIIKIGFYIGISLWLFYICLLFIIFILLVSILLLHPVWSKHFRKSEIWAFNSFKTEEGPMCLGWLTFVWRFLHISDSHKVKVVRFPAGGSALPAALPFTKSWRVGADEVSSGGET